VFFIKFVLGLSFQNPLQRIVMFFRQQATNCRKLLGSPFGQTTYFCIIMLTSVDAVPF
jgi:hypothetical protein